MAETTVTNSLTIASLAKDVLGQSYQKVDVDLTGGTVSAVLPGYAVRAQAALFTESGEGTYEWSCEIPAAAIILNAGLICSAAWDAATSASMEVGIVGDDEDTFFTAVDLKATDLTAGQSVDFIREGGVGGASYTGTGTHWDDRYTGAAAKVISFTAASVGAGTAGRTIAFVEYVVPTMQAATKS